MVALTGGVTQWATDPNIIVGYGSLPSAPTGFYADYTPIGWADTSFPNYRGMVTQAQADAGNSVTPGRFQPLFSRANLFRPDPYYSPPQPPVVSYNPVTATGSANAYANATAVASPNISVTVPEQSGGGRPFHYSPDVPDSNIPVASPVEFGQPSPFPTVSAPNFAQVNPRFSPPNRFGYTPPSPIQQGNQGGMGVSAPQPPLMASVPLQQPMAPEVPNSLGGGNRPRSQPPFSPSPFPMPERDSYPVPMNPLQMMQRERPMPIYPNGMAPPAPQGFKRPYAPMPGTPVSFSMGMQEAQMAPGGQGAYILKSLDNGIEYYSAKLKATTDPKEKKRLQKKLQDLVAQRHRLVSQMQQSGEPVQWDAQPEATLPAAPEAQGSGGELIPHFDPSGNMGYTDVYPDGAPGADALPPPSPAPLRAMGGAKAGEYNRPDLRSEEMKGLQKKQQDRIDYLTGKSAEYGQEREDVPLPRPIHVPWKGPKPESKSLPDANGMIQGSVGNKQSKWAQAADMFRRGAYNLSSLNPSIHKMKVDTYNKGVTAYNTARQNAATNQRQYDEQIGLEARDQYNNQESLDKRTDDYDPNLHKPLTGPQADDIATRIAQAYPYAGPEQSKAFDDAQAQHGYDFSGYKRNYPNYQADLEGKQLNNQGRQERNQLAKEVHDSKVALAKGRAEIMDATKGDQIAKIKAAAVIAQQLARNAIAWGDQDAATRYQIHQQQLANLRNNPQKQAAVNARFFINEYNKQKNFLLSASFMGTPEEKRQALQALDDTFGQANPETGIPDFITTQYNTLQRGPSGSPSATASPSITPGFVAPPAVTPPSPSQLSAAPAAVPPAAFNATKAWAQQRLMGLPWDRAGADRQKFITTGISKSLFGKDWPALDGQQRETVKRVWAGL